MAVIIKKKEAPVEPARGKLTWRELRERFISRRVRGEKVTLAQFAEEEKISLSYLRQICHKGKWMEEVASRIERMDADIVEVTIQRSRNSTSEVQAQPNNDEVSVRSNHVKIARILQAKALRRLRTIPFEQLSPRDALEMLKVGMTEERRGLGMPDLAAVHMTRSEIEAGFKSVEEHIKENAKLRNLGVQLLGYIEGEVVSKKVTPR